jgi:hypothetical protein
MRLFFAMALNLVDWLMSIWSGGGGGESLFGWKLLIILRFHVKNTYRVS